jgi:hypothetical protein
MLDPFKRFRLDPIFMEMLQHVISVEILVVIDVA